MLEHDPEKWIPVFREDHAPPKIRSSRAAPGSNGRERHIKPIAWMRNRPHVPTGAISGRDGNAESAQKVPSKALGLHVSEIQSEAHMGAAAERHESEFMPPARGFHVEACGIVALRLGPNLR